MYEEIVCWKCGEAQQDLPLPVARLAECPACGADLHVCRMCRYFDTGVSNSCREPVAELVKDKGRANFCGYLQVMAHAYRPQGNSKEGGAKAQLDALFGLASDQAGAANSGANGPTTQSDTAKEALKQLFSAGEREKGK